jgi:hypothetical protein
MTDTLMRKRQGLQRTSIWWWMMLLASGDAISAIQSVFS